MKKIAVCLAFGLSAPAFAANTLSIVCAKSDVSCETRVIAALDKIECAPLVNSLKCSPLEGDPAKEVCTINADKCDQPRADGVWVTKCFLGTMRSLRIADKAKGLFSNLKMPFQDFEENTCKL